MSSPPDTSGSVYPPFPQPAPLPARRAFLNGVRSALLSVYILVLAGTYIGIGALAHDFHFSLGWVVASTVLVWAGPAQVILIAALGAGTPLIATAIAVGLSGVRLLPMVVALLPILRAPGVRARDLVLPAHFTAVSMWIESMRLCPGMPRENRLPFANGLAVGYMATAVVFSVVGYFVAAKLPPLLGAATLFLTPMAFLVSVTRNSRVLAERLGLVLGLIVAPLLAWLNVGLDLMWAGLIAGTIGFAAQRLREAMR